jgi:hypothetical protein
MDMSAFEPAWEGSGLEIPAPDDTLAKLDQEMAEDLDIEGRPDAYGIRILFGDDTDNRKVVLMPWLTFDRSRAENLTFTITHDGAFGPLTLGAWLSSGDVDLSEGSWQPLMAKVVKLAVVPF